MTMVTTLNGIPSRPRAERSAMPVTIPGSAIGSRKRKEIASRPKNRVRCTARAASVPIRSARAVAAAAIRIDSPSAAQMSGRFQATWNQPRVKPGGGKRNDASSVVRA